VLTTRKTGPRSWIESRNGKSCTLGTLLSSRPTASVCSTTAASLAHMNFGPSILRHPSILQINGSCKNRVSTSLTKNSGLDVSLSRKRSETIPVRSMWPRSRLRGEVPPRFSRPRKPLRWSSLRRPGTQLKRCTQIGEESVLVCKDRQGEPVGSQFSHYRLTI
jgi:hypothetical protein